MIFVHGRGDASDKMFLLSKQIVNDPGMALIFPKATNNTWYPKAFLAPTQKISWLDSALENMGKVVAPNQSTGSGEKYLSLWLFTGACLAFEYACRNARKYAGVMVLSGGLLALRLIKAIIAVTLPALKYSWVAAIRIFIFRHACRIKRWPPKWVPSGFANLPGYGPHDH
jgi:hypothetical protein